MQRSPSVEEQLAAAAWRILSDGRQHAYETLQWARKYLVRPVVACESAIRHRLPGRNPGFSLRELSLGAQGWPQENPTHNQPRRT